MNRGGEVARRQFLQHGAIFASGIVLWRTNQNSAQAVPALRHPREEGASSSLRTWPDRIYKENDGILEPAATESFVFNLLVKDQNQKIEPQSARLEFYSSGEQANAVELSKKALDAVRGTSISFAGDVDREDEVFDLRHHFSMPVSLNVDRLVDCNS